MNGIKIGLLVSILAVGSGGCVAQGRVHGGAVVTSDPMLVEIHSGVWVIEDYPEPVFYADGYYWRYDDDGWYRSSGYAGGWVRYSAVPRVILRIDEPRRYVHYRAAPGHRMRRGPSGAISVRDRRDDAPPRTDDSGSDWQPPRDEQQARREEKREEKADRAEEKREEKAERVEEKREEKAEKVEEKREDMAEKREDKAEEVEEKREDMAEKREDKAEKREDKAEKREEKAAKSHRKPHKAGHKK